MHGKEVFQGESSCGRPQPCTMIHSAFAIYSANGRHATEQVHFLAAYLLSPNSLSSSRHLSPSLFCCRVLLAAFGISPVTCSRSRRLMVILLTRRHGRRYRGTRKENRGRRKARLVVARKVSFEYSRTDVWRLDMNK